MIVTVDEERQVKEKKIRQEIGKIIKREMLNKLLADPKMVEKLFVLCETLNLYFPFKRQRIEFLNTYQYDLKGTPKELLNKGVVDKILDFLAEPTFY